MRDYFIRSFEQIVNVLVVLGAIAVVIAALVTMFSPMGGFFQALGVLIFGAISLVLSVGVIYLMLGIYDNTRRTAIATEALSARR